MSEPSLQGKVAFDTGVCSGIKSLSPNRHFLLVFASILIIGFLFLSLSSDESILDQVVVTEEVKPEVKQEVKTEIKPEIKLEVKVGPSPAVGKLKYKAQEGKNPAWFDSVGGVRNSIPSSMMVIGGGNVPILWCPIAKAGTSTIYESLQPLVTDRCYNDCPISAWKQFQHNKTLREDMMMTQAAISFAVVRNPWDRIRSAYEGKIATQKIILEGVQTFPEFVRYISDNSHTLENDHWKPYNKRCFTSPNKQNRVFQYTHIIRMEEGFMEGLNEVFAEAGNPIRATFTANRKNVSHSLHARIEYYQQAAAEAGMPLEELTNLVYETFKDDIEAWNYSFRVFGQ